MDFVRSYFSKNEPLTSWTLFSRSALISTDLEKKWGKMCSTGQRFICTEVTSYKIHILVKKMIKWWNNIIRIDHYLKRRDKILCIWWLSQCPSHIWRTQKETTKLSQRWPPSVSICHFCFKFSSLWYASARHTYIYGKKCGWYNQTIYGAKSLL